VVYGGEGEITWIVAAFLAMLKEDGVIAEECETEPLVGIGMG